MPSHGANMQLPCSPINSAIMATRAACLLGLARALRAPRFALRAATTSPPPPPEAYVELVLRTGGAHSDTPSAEELSEVLMEYGAMSVTASCENDEKSSPTKCVGP